jgi:hypothetical protein
MLVSGQPDRYKVIDPGNLESWDKIRDVPVEYHPLGLICFFDDAGDVGNPGLLAGTPHIF